MSSRIVEIIPSAPHVFKYRVESDAFSAEFDADSIDAARERLHRYAAAAPEFETDLFEWVAEDEAWAWVSTVAHSQELDKVERVLG